MLLSERPNLSSSCEPGIITNLLTGVAGSNYGPLQLYLYSQKPFGST
jgi:hypothetical protein